MASINVGAVEVTVTPNAQGFAAKLGSQVTPQAQALGDSLGRLIGDAIAKQVQDGINRGLGTTPSTRTQGQRQGDTYAGSFADAFRARIAASMRSLPEIKLTANSSDAEIKLQGIRSQLETLSNLRIGVDIDETAAFTELELLQAKLEELHANASTIQVKADTAAAKAELDLLIEQVRRVGAESPDIKVDVDAAGAEAELTALGAQADAAGGGFNFLLAAGLALGPALIPVLAAVTAAAAGLVGVLGAVGVAAGVGILAFHGIAAGVTALDKSHKAAASSGASLANQQIGMAGAARQVKAAEDQLANTRANAAEAAIRSAEAVKNAKQAEKDAVVQASRDMERADRDEAAARQAVTDATVAGGRQIKSAQDQLAAATRSLTDAQNNELDAENALNTARQTAQQQLEDLANQVIDGQNAQRQGVLDVQSAQDQLNQTQADPNASQQQREQAQLTYDEAVQHLQELQIQNARLAAQQEQANQAGVEGSKVVTDAQKNIATAQQAVVDAQANQVKAAQGVTDAQVASARAIKDAQASLSAAIVNEARVQVDSQEKVRKAQQGVTDAIRAQRDQQRQSAESIKQAINSVASAQEALARSSNSIGGGAGIAQQADAFQKLSPVAQQFARFVHDELIPAFSGIQGAAAKGLLPGVEAGLKTLLPVLPGVTSFVGKVAKAMGDLFDNAAKALTDPFWSNFFKFAGDSVIPTLKGVATFVGDVAGGFAGLLQAFAPVMGTLGGGMLGIAGAFKKFGEQAGTPGSPFQTFLGYVEQYLPVVGQFFSNLFDLVGNVVQAMAPFGGAVLIVVNALTSFLDQVSPQTLGVVIGSIGTLILAFQAFKGVSAIIGALNGLIGILGSEMVIATGPVGLIAAAVVIAGGAFYLLYTHSKTVHDWVNEHLLPLFHQLSDYFTDTVLPVLKKVGGEAMDGIRQGLGIVGDAINQHKPQIDELKTAFKDVVDFIVEKVLPLLGPTLKGAFIATGGFIAGLIDIIAGIITAFDAVQSAIPGIWNSIADTFVSGVNSIIGVLNWFIGALKNIPGVHIDTIGPIGGAKHISSSGDKTTSGKGTGLPGGQRGFAAGGVLPGYAPGVDSIVAMLSPGEGVLVPEAVRLLGPDWVHAMNAYASRGRGGSSRPGHYSFGGIVDGIGSGIKTGIGAVTGIVSTVENKAIDEAVSTAKHFANGVMPRGFFRDIADGTLDKIGNTLKFANGGVVGNPWGALARSVGSYSSVDASQALTAYSPTVHVTNNHRPMGPSDIVTGMQQHYTLYGRHLMAGTGIPGVG